MYKYVNSIISDREKKKANVFDESFLQVYCSQIGVYTASDMKLLLCATYLIIGEIFLNKMFFFLSSTFFFIFVYRVVWRFQIFGAISSHPR